MRERIIGMIREGVVHQEKITIWLKTTFKEGIIDMIREGVVLQEKIWFVLYHKSQKK